MKRSSRRNDRAPVALAADLWRHRATIRTEIRDLGEGGLCLVTGEELAPGAFVTIGLRLPGGPRFTALCRVAWARADRRGLEFLDVPLPARRGIGALVRGGPSRREDEAARQGRAA